MLRQTAVVCRRLDARRAVAELLAELATQISVPNVFAAALPHCQSKRRITQTGQAITPDK